MNEPARKQEILSEISRRKEAIRAELIKRGALEASTVIGFVHPEKGHTHTLRKEAGSWVASLEKPEVYLPAKLERVIKSNKRFICIIGGRGSAKSVGVADIRMIQARDGAEKTYFLREYQSSIKQSVYSLIKSEIERLGFSNFGTKYNSFEVDGEEVFSFSGIARNTDTIKSTHGFSCFAIEEAQFTTQDSLDALTPTLRNKPNKGLPRKFSEEEVEISNDPSVSMIFIANPGSTEDPFSKRFINPYWDSIQKDGFYEDDLHLIVLMNYTDNPWFDESGLEEERRWDYEHRPRALYDHIWLGAMNDSIDNALVMSEWFDACVDAHIKLGFEPRGARIASHDPSDMGPDPKGYSFRHGNVFLRMEEKDDGNVNEGGHWAAKLAIEDQADYFTWDGDGMGIALDEQISRDFEGKSTELVVFRGSESPDNPKDIYQSATKAKVDDQKTIGDSFLNKRAQYYFELRDRCYRTYRAVVFGEYHDPDTLISFSSDMAMLSKFRSELCRMPIKETGSGLFELYTKQVMKKTFKVASPNLSDCGMMSMRYKPPRTHETLNFRRKWR